MPPPAAIVAESARLDAAHNDDRNGNTGGSRVISLGIRLPNGSMYYCVRGNHGACHSQPVYRPAPLGDPFPGRSRHLYAIPTQSVFPRIHFHTRHGGAGALRGFAHDAQKNVHAENLKLDVREILSTRRLLKPARKRGGSLCLR